jgi:CheY-like chemotaxis protein
MIHKVMCIDDDTITLRLCQIILEKANFCDEIITVENGELALEYFEIQNALPAPQQKLPGLIFLDLNMPVMDGWEFLDSFSEKFSLFQQEVKIIILSSSVNPQDKIKADNNPNVICFISKPLSISGLNNLKEIPDLRSFFSAS